MFKQIFTAIVALTLVTLASTNVSAIGLMLPSDTSVRPFDVESHRAEIVITNNTAVTKVTQVFRNHTNRPMEAVFVFPIPEDGTVSDFSLWIEGKKTKGAVLEKNEARRIYESIVRRVEDPGLIEYMDGKLFRASIFPIPPKGTQKLELIFGQVMNPQGDAYHYKYPISAGSDYVTAKTASDFTVTATINATIPISTVYSPTHTIGVHRKKNNRVIVGAEEMHVALDRDFELFVGYSKKEIGVNLITHDPDGDGPENGYFLLALAPTVQAAAHKEIGQTFTFVMDTSGSMAGQKIEQARDTIAFCVKRLRPQDHFNIIRFSTDVEPLFSAPMAATESNKTEGLEFARELSPAGGTAIDGALQAALGQKTPSYQPHQIIFVTDGLPTVGATAPDAIARNAKTRTKPNTRLFTFGIGFQINSVLLDTLAANGRGRADYVKPDGHLENAVASLYSRISSPVLSGISVDFGGARIYDAYPSPLPDLFKGDQIVLLGRHRKAFNKPIVVTGHVGKQVKTFRFGGKKKSGSKPIALTEAAEAPLEFIPKLWATRKVGFLLDQIRTNGEQPELKNEVIRLAKKFGLVTPYTSFLAVDDREFERRPVEPRLNDEPRPDFRPRPMPKRRPRPSTKGMGGRASAAPAAAEEAFAEFDASSGEGAIEASKATRSYKESKKVSSESLNTRRYIGKSTFELKSGTWVQEGLSIKSKGKTVKAFSKQYYALLKKHPELKRILTLGNRVVVKFGKQIYRFTP